MLAIKTINKCLNNIGCHQFEILNELPMSILLKRVNNIFPYKYGSPCDNIMIDLSTFEKLCKLNAWDSIMIAHQDSIDRIYEKPHDNIIKFPIQPCFSNTNNRIEYTDDKITKLSDLVKWNDQENEFTMYTPYFSKNYCNCTDINQLVDVYNELNYIYIPGLHNHVYNTTQILKNYDYNIIDTLSYYNVPINVIIKIHYPFDEQLLLKTTISDNYMNYINMLPVYLIYISTCAYKFAYSYNKNKNHIDSSKLGNCYHDIRNLVYNGLSKIDIYDDYIFCEFECVYVCEF
jgi:hypothetical protein